MSRYKAGTKAETRARIVDEASRQFRSKGVEATSIADVMGAVDLTVGGFYKHFASKDELFRESLAAALKSSARRIDQSGGKAQGDAWLRSVAEVYLTPLHRDNVSKGCAIAALSTDIARADESTRSHFEALLTEYLNIIEARGEGLAETARAEAWRFVATLLGGLILSRSVASEALSKEILAACSVR